MGKLASTVSVRNPLIREYGFHFILSFQIFGNYGSTSFLINQKNLRPVTMVYTSE